MNKVFPSLLTASSACSRYSAGPARGRFYSTAPASSSSSSTPLYLALAALVGGGGGYYLYQKGHVPSPKDLKDAEEKAKNAISGALGQAKEKTSEAASSLKPALDSKEWRNFKVASVEPYNHNTSRFVFELPEGTDSGLTVASALLTKAVKEGEGLDDKGKPAIRPYTPVTAPDQTGRIDLLIKKYPGGKMTEHIHSLKPGDELALKGPIPKFEYKPNQFETIGLIGGGSVTPLWQLIQKIDSNPSDKTKAVLIYSNQTPEDILLRKEFEELAKRKPEQFKIVFTVDKPSRDWKGPTGYMTRELLKDNLPMPGFADKIKVFVCGPPPQVESISGNKVSPKDQGELKGHLADLGYSVDQVYKF